jgi:hypothetical protein
MTDLSQRNYVRVTWPPLRNGHRYYGCVISKCESCKHKNWRDDVYPIHCYVCNGHMFNSDKLGTPYLELVQDQFVFCSDCYKVYIKRLAVVHRRYRRSSGRSDIHKRN